MLHPPSNKTADLFLEGRAGEPKPRTGRPILLGPPRHWNGVPHACFGLRGPDHGAHRMIRTAAAR